MLGCSSTFFNKERIFNSKYPQLQVAKDFAVAEKKLHLTASGRKYHSGKKAPKKRRTSSTNTAAPKASTSQEQQPTQSETITEQQPQSETVTEQQPQSETVTDTEQEHVQSQFSSNDDEELPNPFPTSSKTFETKDPKSIPKKPKYSLRPK